MQKISCIICAHNEAQRIGDVLSAVQNHPFINEVIVVDDGSTDGTAYVVRGMPWVKLVSYPVNHGKSYALAAGIENAQHDTLLFLDADLVGITADDITKLIDPVREGKVDVSMSLRKNSSFIYNYPQLIGLDYVSGERVMPKWLFNAESLKTLCQLPSLGAEVYVNKLILKENLNVEIVQWKSVLNPSKTEKIGLWQGLKKEVRMINDILEVTPLPEIVRQNVLMRLRSETR